MIYAFGDCELDTDTVELRVDGKRQSIEPQVFDLLAYLIGNRTRVVDKQELLEEVWGSRFVSESALTSRVKSARRAIGDDGRSQQVIRTVHGRGYQFVAPVHTPEQRPFPSTVVQTPLPIVANPLIGREQELADLCDILARERLVTLLGPGGVGKTRLAIEAAARVAGRYRDGACFVELTRVRDPKQVPGLILDAFGLPGEPDMNPIAALRETLRGRELLLLLDNVEHVIDAVPSVSELLRHVPGLRILTTSRERLRVAGEQVFDVVPLATGGTTDTAPALVLFERVASTVDPSFTLGTANLADVTAICQAVDGLPLGIELVAGQVRMLPPMLLRLQLGTRLATVSDGLRDRPTRQQTMRATLDWSFHLLPPVERQLFVRLAVFSGPASFDAISQVCGSDEEVTTALAALIDKSLVRRVEGLDGLPRFTMLELIREYAAGLFTESAEFVDTRGRHARYIVDRLAHIESERWTTAAGTWIDEINAMLADIRAARDWAQQGSDRQIAARIVALLYGFWRRMGNEAEGRAWTAAALGVDDLDQTTAGQLRLAAGYLEFYQGHMDQARRHWEIAVALFSALGSPRYQALSQMNVASTSIGEPSEYDTALRLCEEAIATARLLDEKPLIAHGLNMKGELARVHGEDETARPAYQEGLELARAAGDLTDATVFTANLAYLAEHRGDHEEARLLGHETLRLCWSLGRRMMAAWTLGEMAGPESGLGRAERAARMIGASGEALRLLDGSLGPGDQPEHTRVRAELDRLLGSPRFHALLGEGQAMSLDEAVAYALADPDGAG